MIVFDAEIRLGKAVIFRQNLLEQQKKSVQLESWTDFRIIGIPSKGYAPKLSKRIFSAGTPRLSSIFTTDDAIIGGPHIK
jgi:hypothetical protein